jgi:hypothetical protein
VQAAPTYVEGTASCSASGGLQCSETPDAQETVAAIETATDSYSGALYSMKHYMTSLHSASSAPQTTQPEQQQHT